MKSFFTKALVVGVLISFIQPLYAQQDIEAGLQAIADEYRAVGLAVVVIKDDKPIYSKALGYKDLERKEPLATDNLFRIASISKSFTATAIMQLVEQGKLSLGDDMSKLMGFTVRNPKFPDTPITLRMLLSHTSSINDSNGYFDLNVINPSKSTDWAKSYSDYAPGEGYAYCNLNFNMLGGMLERLTGKRFDNYIQETILQPLGLAAGYCVDSLDNKRFATLYEYKAQTNDFSAQPAAYNPRTKDIENYVLGQSTPVFSPTGGLKISATDLATYMQMHMNYGAYKDGKRLITAESAKLMQTAVAVTDGYGLALSQSQQIIPGVTLVGHTGSAYGLYSTMFFNPEQKYGFIVVTNGCIADYENDYVMLSVKAVNYLFKKLIE